MKVKFLSPQGLNEFLILRVCTSLGVDKNDFEGNMHVILRRQHLNFYLTTITKTVLSFCFCTLELVYIYYIELYLTTSIFNTVVSFCFCTLELVAISPRNKPIVIFHRKLRIMCRGELYLTTSLCRIVSCF